MKEITGTFSSSKIFTDVVEEKAIEQIQTLCNQPFTEGCRIRVTPDAHSGKGCVIGFYLESGIVRKGAERLFSRNTAREKFTVEEFSAAMDGIFTTSVGEGTLDECPMAYKSMNDIVDNIEPTAEIISTIKPKYNFKAGM
ncbi:MAG: RtcB family protein [Acutalibacteraceae bacterium]